MSVLIIVALVLAVTAMLVVGDAPEYAIILGVIAVGLVAAYWITA